MGKLLGQAFLGLTFSAIAVLGADNSLGTWKLNVEKSTINPAPASQLKSLMQVREASDGGVKVTVTAERADGTKINSSVTVRYGSTAATVTGEGLAWDSVSVKQVNANTFTEERKKTGGSYRASARRVISNGGKTMTVTAKGIDADGKAFTSTLVSDKQ